METGQDCAGPWGNFDKLVYTLWLPVMSIWLRDGFNLNHSQASAFLQKEPRSYACDPHYITNLSKMFTIIFESSPLLPIKKKKKNPPGKALLKILLAITLDFRECKCKRSGNKKPLMWGKNRFREKWIQQTRGTCTLLKKSLCILLPNYVAS